MSHTREVLRKVLEQRFFTETPAWERPGYEPPPMVHASNLTRTAAGPFDPQRPWLDQVLDSCSLDSHDRNHDNRDNKEPSGK